MTYMEKVIYLTNIAERLSTAVLDMQTELSELRILLQVNKDIASKQFEGTTEAGEKKNG